MFINEENYQRFVNSKSYKKLSKKDLFSEIFYEDSVWKTFPSENLVKHKKLK